MRRLRDDLRVVLRWPVARRTLRIALVVGTLVSLVNQAGAIMGGQTTTGTWIRVGANYLLPFCVASFSYVTALRP